MENLLGSETAKRLARREAGESVAKRLAIGSMEPGQAGVLQATVLSVSPPRSFNRKNGTQGTVGRVSLSDGTGEVDAVLWDDENRLTAETLVPGKTVRIRGAVVKAGFRGGIELAIGQATIDEASSEGAVNVSGTVAALGDTRIEGDRFQMDVTLDTDKGQRWLVVWDEQVKEIRGAGIGASLQFEGLVPHPVLDDWYLADGASLLAQSS